MLVLSRKVGDAIVIDGGIRLTVIAIRGRQARVAIEAPPGVGILRDELLSDGRPGSVPARPKPPIARRPAPGDGGGR